MSWVAVAIGGSALVSAGGAYIGSQANKSAADKAADATLQGAQINAKALEDARLAQEKLSREGLSESTSRFDRIAAENEPAKNYLRTVMADPGSLTPQQAQALLDLRRSTGNMIGSSSIAGSGRTASSLLRRTESDFTNEALAENRKRADDAAGKLYGTGSTAEVSAAGLPANVLGHVGDVTANLMAKSGDVQNKATQQAGLFDAAGTLATGKLAGTAIGDVGSVISSEGRASRYGLRSLPSATPATQTALDTGYYAYGAGGLGAA